MSGSSAVPVFSDAWRALWRNYVWVAVYAGVAVVFNGLFYLYSDWAHTFITDDSVPGWIPPLNIATDLLYAAAWSAMQALVFTAIGAEIDRPLWKCSGPREALYRYFLPWFLLTLIAITLMRLTGRALAAGNTGLAVFFEMLHLVLMMVTVPFGACIMYHRGLVWSEVPEALAPIARFSQAAAGVLLIGMFQWFYLWSILLFGPGPPGDVIAVKAGVEIPVHFLDCLAFAAMWVICMLDRDREMGSPPGGFEA